MVVNSAVACDTTALPQRVDAAIGHMIKASFGLLKKRLEEDLQQRSLPESCSIEQLADFYTTVMTGMAVMAKVGATRERLFDTIEQALCALPELNG